MDTRTPQVPCAPCQPRLQWSHDLSAMDTGMSMADVRDKIELQWSHDLSAMDTGKPPPVQPAHSSFNGAMTSQPWIHDHQPPHRPHPRQLQWSHDLSAMDTCPHRSHRPRPRSFNGAMTSQPWIPDPPASSAVPPASFNGAMTSQPWIPGLASTIACTAAPCFNGAMTSQPWIQDGQDRRDRRRHASMEP